jgi:hypothetical protein
VTKINDPTVPNKAHLTPDRDDYYERLLRDAADDLGIEPEVFQREWAERERLRATDSNSARAATRNGSGHQSESGDGISVLVSEVERKPVDWLWKGYLPLGMLTMLDGDPGTGKSTILLDIVARVTTASAMPDGAPGLPGPRGAVILSCEDTVAHIIRPRLEAAGADIDRIRVLTGVYELDGDRLPHIKDLKAIEQEIRSVDAAILVVDPLMGFLPANCDAHRDPAVRRALGPLTKLVERLHIASTFSRHFTKAGEVKAVYRGGGSIGLIAAVRVAFLVASDPNDAERRILAPVKMNLATMPSSLAYRIVGHVVPADARGPAVGTSRIQWEGATEHSASGLLAAEAEQLGRTTKLGRAEAILHKEILDQGRVAASRIEALAEEVGVSMSTFRSARKRLKLEVTRAGRRGAGRGLKEVSWQRPGTSQGDEPPAAPTVRDAASHSPPPDPAASEAVDDLPGPPTTPGVVADDGRVPGQFVRSPRCAGPRGGCRLARAADQPARNDPGRRGELEEGDGRE